MMLVLVIIALIINALYIGICVQDLLTIYVDDEEKLSIIVVLIPFVLNTIIAVWSIT